MSENVQRAAEALIKLGGEKTIFAFERAGQPDGAPAFVARFIPLAAASAFSQGHEKELAGEDVTFFTRSIVPPPIPQEEWWKRLRNGEHVSRDLYEDIWLIVGIDFEIQLEILNQFCFDLIATDASSKIFTTEIIGKFATEGRDLMAEFKNDLFRILKKIAKNSALSVAKAVAGATGIRLRSQVSLRTVNLFLPDLVEFQHKYDRAEMSPKTLRSQILRSSIVPF